MAGSTTMVQDTIQKWEARMDELRPLIDEYRELEQALEAVRGRVESAKPQRRNGGGRRSRNGGRAQEFVSLVENSPGITVAEAAKRMKINPNYLYRVAGDLAKKGKVEKQGQGYVLVGGSESQTDDSTTTDEGGNGED